MSFITTITKNSRFLSELNIELLYNPAVLLLGIYPKELKQVFGQMLVQNVHSSIIHHSQKVETLLFISE